MTSTFRLRAIGVLASLATALLALPCAGVITNVYFTQFEASEGYDPGFTLGGQLGWMADGTGGNGLFSGSITGQGQHAYVGEFPPLSTNETQLFVWRPINYDPLAAGLPIVKFSTTMQIVDSTDENGHYDYFRWSVYNTQVRRLLSLEFDNGPLDVNYLRESTNVIATGFGYEPGEAYELVITMNFAANRWSATLGDTVVVTNQFITTNNALLNLGDVDAVWILDAANAPGDNFMAFDNYLITAESLPVTPPEPAQIQLLSRTSEGWALLLVTGQDGTRWSVDATTNFIHWTALATNPISGNSFDHIDITASGIAHRYYRARWVP